MYYSRETTDVKTRGKNNSEFVRKHALSQLSFRQLDLSLMLMPKSKKTLETSLDLTPLFKTSVKARVEGLVLNADCLENWWHNFIQKKYGRKRCLPCTHVSLCRL